MLSRQIIDKRERNSVLRIYFFLLAIIIIDPLLSGLIQSTTTLRLAELFCLIGILIIEARLFFKNRLYKYHGLSKFLIFLLFCVSTYIVFRAEFPSSIKGWGLFLVSKNGMLGYLMAFIILLLPNKKYWKDILKYFYYASLFAIPIWLLNADQLVQVGTYKGEGIGALLPFFAAFLLGFLGLFKGRQKNLIIIIWAIYFILMMLNARRNVSFSLALYAFLAYVCSVLYSFNKNPVKNTLIVMISVLMMSGLLLSSDKLATGVFKNMAGRAGEDTRSGVEELFFVDFATSPVEDWIFGRGMDGGYYQVERNEDTGEVSDNRQGIETGYLNMVLKGGIIYDVIIILLMLVALKGCFKKDTNINQKYMALILLSYFWDNYSTNPIIGFHVRSIIFYYIISVLLQSKQNRIVNI